MATSKRFCPTLALHSCWPPEVSLKMTVTASWPALLIFGVDEHRGRSDAQTAASWRATARAALLVTPHISLASIIAFLFAWCCNVLPSYRLSRFGNGFGGETHKHMDKHKQTNTRTNTHTHTHTHTRTHTHKHTDKHTHAHTHTHTDKHTHAHTQSGKQGQSKTRRRNKSNKSTSKKGWLVMAMCGAR